MRWRTIATICALACVPAAAFAGVADKGRGQAPGALAQSGLPKESADQAKRRQDYTASTTTKIRAAVQKSKKPMSADMKALTQKHWRIAMRLLRVQRIAENTAKPAIAKRATDALGKEDTRFFAKLDELAKGAPSSSPSPSASGGAK